MMIEVANLQSLGNTDENGDEDGYAWGRQVSSFLGLLQKVEIRHLNNSRRIRVRPARIRMVLTKRG
jgi:hypothetical protein